MDITEFNIDVGVDSSSGGEKIKPGRYNLEYKGSDMIEGANGWKALKIMFEPLYSRLYLPGFIFSPPLELSTPTSILNSVISI